MAREAGMSQATLSRVVRGQRRATLDELSHLSGAMDLPLSYFLRKDSLPESTSMAARSADGPSMELLQRRIAGFIDADRHLEEYGF